MVVDGNNDIALAEDDKVLSQIRWREIHREVEEEGIVVAVMVRAGVPDHPSLRSRRHVRDQGEDI